VLEDLDGRVDLILEGGPTDVGVESTIVDLSGARPRLLRPGGLAAEQIEAALGVTLEPPPMRATPGPQVSPGLLSAHYAPRTPLVLILGEPERARQRLRDELRRAGRVGVLLLDEDAELVPEHVVVERVGGWRTPEATAARLFEALRALDRLGLEQIYARTLSDPSAGLGRALADRLRRAAARVIQA
jgi:L-threonylcarbamoyladenylate synthase